MSDEPLMTFEEEGRLIHHRLLGDFRRTSIIRVPEVGDYYWCERTIGVAVATTRGKPGYPREILRCVKVKA